MSVEYADDVPFVGAPRLLQNALIGPCIAGYQVQFILFGILIQQVIEWGPDFRKHSRLGSWTAGVVFVLNIVYTALCFEDGYNLAASSDRTVVTLFNGSVEWQFLPFLNGLIAATAEAFLTLRAGAFFLNKKAKICFYVWQTCLIILVLFGSVASLVEGLIGSYRPYAEETIAYNTAVSLWLWACAAADFSISIALAYNLNKRIAHFNQATDSVLRKLIMIGLRTASFTTILSVAGALMSSIYSGWDPSKVNLPVAFWAPTGALYGISLFTTLTATRQVVEKRLGGNSNSLVPNATTRHSHQHLNSSLRRTISGIQIPRPSALGGHGLHHHHKGVRGEGEIVIPLAINVHREVVRDVDSEDKEGFEESLSGSHERGAPSIV
ncbi:hypothetical protein JCM16303_002463 [Sporobolomyces ruberrimus]